MNQTKLLFPLIFISLEDDSSIVIPPQPTSPGEIMSGGEGEPVEADEPEEGATEFVPQISPACMALTERRYRRNRYIPF